MIFENKYKYNLFTLSILFVYIWFRIEKSKYLKAEYLKPSSAMFEHPKFNILHIHICMYIAETHFLLFAVSLIK